MFFFLILFCYFEILRRYGVFFFEITSEVYTNGDGIDGIKCNLGDNKCSVREAL